MKHKLRSQKMNLFIYYALLITLLLFICFCVFYIYYRQNIYKDAKTHANNLCTSVSNSVFTELESMSTVSMNTIYSNTIQKNLVNIKDINYEQLSLNPSYASSRDSVLNIYDTIAAIIGPFQSVTQINVFALDGTAIGSGFYQYTGTVSLSQKDWYAPTLKNKGSKYITAPDFLVDMPSLNMGFKDKKYLSLCRVFFDAASKPQGIVQIIQDCDTIFSFTRQNEESNPDISVYVYNDRGEIVYPYIAHKTLNIDYNLTIQNNHLQPLESYTVSAKDPAQRAILSYIILPKYDWKVVVVQPRAVLLKPLYTFTKSFIIVVFLGIFVTLLLCFFVADRLTSPLHELATTIKQVNINDVLDRNTSLVTFPDSSIEEIHALFQSFNSMYNKLCQSSQEIMNIKSEETRAKMSATQAMINPHFLYNNLTTISILAEENMTDKIVFMCNSLCDYFRYITVTDEASVTIESEALYTEKYIACMQIRFGRDFNYMINLPYELKGIRIPKLIVQPLVENAFKYAFNTAPPWKLDITAEIKEDRWFIHVEDNGIGMTQLQMNELLKTLSYLKTTREISSLKIGGMGIKNVYLRLILLYNEKAFFDIESVESQGTRITIGGPIHPEEV